MISERSTSPPRAEETAAAPEEKLQIEERIVTMLKTVYDPEIPVDIYNLGLIYSIDLDV